MSRQDEVLNEACAELTDAQAHDNNGWKYVAHGLADRVVELEEKLANGQDALDAASLRGFIDTYGTTPFAIACERDALRARCEALERDRERLRRAIVAFLDDDDSTEKIGRHYGALREVLDSLDAARAQEEKA